MAVGEPSRKLRVRHHAARRLLVAQNLAHRIEHGSLRLGNQIVAHISPVVNRETVKSRVQLGPLSWQCGDRLFRRQRLGDGVAHALPAKQRALDAHRVLDTPWNTTASSSFSSLASSCNPAPRDSMSSWKSRNSSIASSTVLPAHRSTMTDRLACEIEQPWPSTPDARWCAARCRRPRREPSPRHRKWG